MNSIHEECGVFGIYSTADDDLAALTYYGLYALQHRGQESAGIALNDDGVFRCIKGEGLISEVFSGDKLKSLGTGHIAVGHVRYATTGSNAAQNIQPLLGAIFHTTTDSEVISYMVVQERLRHGSIENAVSAAMESIEGAYSLVICSPQKLIAVRDPHGFRPLC